MKTIICGGRDYHFRPDDIAWLDGLRTSLPITEVMTGGAAGADSDGKYWAIERRIPSMEITADWKAHGKAAGPLRNKQMARWGECVVAFPGGRGTADMIRQAKAHGLPVYERAR